MFENTGRELIFKLNDPTTIHRIQNLNDYLESDATIFFNRYSANKFQRILIDLDAVVF